MIRLAFGLFIALLHVGAVGQVSIDANGTVSSTQCQYGRGQIAVGGARDRALSEIADFLQGPRLIQELEAEDVLEATDSSGSSAATLLQEQRSFLLRGNSVDSLRFNVSPPWIQGNDTCVRVDLLPVVPDAGPSQGDVLVRVEVIGQGYPSGEQTALERAEADALRRAVSQVVGTWLSEQRAESSALSLAIENDSEQTVMSDLMTHHLVSRSTGYVSDWTLLERKALENGGVEILISAQVDGTQLREQGQSLLAELGSPRVSVIADPPLDALLLEWLSAERISTDANAPLKIRALSNLREYGSNRRMDLSIEVTDNFGNLYGAWRNTPSLIALPDGPNVYQDLAEVHLSTEKQKASLSAALRGAFMKVLGQGGLVREVQIPLEQVDDSVRLMTILSMIGGVSDVNHATVGDRMSVQMRYPGPTAELASALQASLAHVGLTTGSRFLVISDSLIQVQ
ncbi:MAG: hypothetical protein V2J20_02775 [Wenzhouxiangella sp.]|jgi:hypothetical protein|nr:hypothetical protein [Wenzhouxiangella sp.]